MNIKILASTVALAVSGSLVSVTAAVAQSTTETTIERSSSTRVDVPRPSAKVKEESSTTTRTKRGITGRTKSETTSSSRRYEESDPTTANNTEFRSKTTIETEKKY